MFSDNAFGRAGFFLLLFLGIIAYLYLVIVGFFWQLPVNVFGQEAVKGFYEYVAVVVSVLVLAELFILGPRRDRKTPP